MKAAATTLNMGHLPFMLMNERWEIKDWFSPSGKRSADLRIDKPFRLLEISSFINRICRYTDEEDAKSVQ